MFYILKGEDETTVIESTAINHGSNRGFETSEEAYKAAGLELPEDSSDEFYAAVKTRLITGAESRRVDAKGIGYPTLAKAVLSACEEVDFSGDVDAAVEAALVELKV